jgi:hypothetical protein
MLLWWPGNQRPPPMGLEQKQGQLIFKITNAPRDLGLVYNRGGQAQWFEPCHNYFFKYYFLLFFVLYINFNLSDDIFEE